MNETIFQNDRIDIAYNVIDEEYKISLFDKHCHYLDEFIIDKEQYDNLKEFFKTV